MTTVCLQRQFVLSSVTIKRLTESLEEYVRGTGASVDILLIGGLALQAYGYSDRVTVDMDGEMAGDPEPLVIFLRARQIPADLGEDLSRWSVIAMPPGYRERTSVLLEQPGLRLRLLHPIDFVIAKLRRGTDLDLQDAAYVMRRFDLSIQAVEEAAASAIAASPKDTTLFLFRTIVQAFCGRRGENP